MQVVLHTPTSPACSPPTPSKGSGGVAFARSKRAARNEMLRQLSRLGYRERDATAATLHQGCLIGDGFRRAGVLELDPTCLTRFREREGHFVSYSPT